MSISKELKEILKEHSVRSDVDSIIIDTEGMVKVEQYFKDNPPGSTVSELKVPVMEFGVANGNDRIYPRASLKNIPDATVKIPAPAADKKIAELLSELFHNQGADPKLLAEYICDIVDGNDRNNSMQREPQFVHITINYLKKYLPELFEQCTTHEEELEVLRAHDRWQADMAFINSLDIPDKYPNIKYDAINEISNYTTDRYMSKCRAYRLGITVTSNGNILHPRHWSYCPATRDVTYMDYKVIDGVMLVNKAESAENDDGLAAIYQRVREYCKDKNIRVQFSNELETLDEITSLSTPGSASIMNVIKGRQAPLQSGAVHYLYDGQIPDWDSVARALQIPSNPHKFSENDEGTAPTVKGNSRQKIIDNGKRQWPEARTRKGRRNR